MISPRMRALREADIRVKQAALDREHGGDIGYMGTTSDMSIFCRGEHVTADFKGVRRFEQATEWLNGLADKWEAEANGWI